MLRAAYKVTTADIRTDHWITLELEHMKRFLMALGALALVPILAGVVALGYVGTKAFTSADSNTKIAVSHVRTISKNWSMSNRTDIVDASLARQARTQRVMAFMQNVSRLGQLVTVANAQQTAFHMSSTEGTTAKIEFDGTFTNGTAKIIVTLRKSDGQMKLYGIKVVDGRIKPPSRAVAA